MRCLLFALVRRGCLVVYGLSMVLVASIAPGAEPSSDATPVEIPTRHYVRLMMARDPAVHRELKLSAAQRAKVEAAVGEVDQPFWRLRDVPPTQCDAELTSLDQALSASLEAALTAEQRARLEQLVMQARGAKALTAPDVRRTLALNDDQAHSIAQLIGSAENKTLSPDKLLDILTPAQRSSVADLFGPRFDLGRISRIASVAPEMQSVEAWVNSEPLTLASLRGKVVVVHFWAFGCINCIRNLPHYQAWNEKFAGKDLEIIGIHTPETAAERDLDQLRSNVAQRGIEYPVAFDLKGQNWNNWANHMWPSVYLIDRQGQVRAWWYGELNWQGATGEEQMRKRIGALIAER